MKSHRFRISKESSEIVRDLINRDRSWSNSLRKLIQPFLLFILIKWSQVEEKSREESTECQTNEADGEESNTNNHQNDILDGGEDERGVTEREDVGFDVRTALGGRDSNARDTLSIWERPHNLLS